MIDGAVFVPSITTGATIINIADDAGDIIVKNCVFQGGSVCILVLLNAILTYKADWNQSKP